MFAPVLGLLLIAGCGAAAGEPCQEDDDCEDGLECVKPSSAPASRGTCQPSGTEPPRPDAGPGVDAGPEEDAGGGTDSGIPCDPTADGGACPSGHYCAETGPMMCDAPSFCEPFEESCPGVFDPVCGCDARTYVNECEAHREQVRVASEGACGPPPADAGGTDAGPEDAGTDAGPADAGGGTDAGGTDAGDTDAGSGTDSGT